MDAKRRGRPGIPLLAAVGAASAAIVVGMVAAQGPLGQGPIVAVPAADPAPSTEDVPPPSVGYAVWGTDRQGDPLRWDACRPVPFVLNPHGAPDEAEADLREALAILREASGLELVLAGVTDERPDVRRPLVVQDEAGWRWRPVLVAWGASGEGGMPLTVHDRGVALPVAVRAAGREAFVTGQVVINAARTDLVPGFGDRSDALGATLLHELGHVLGLDHVADGTQIMGELPGRGPVVLGAGDRAGLQAVGAAMGCNPAPPASSGRRLVGPP